MTSPSATNTALAEPELKTCPFCGGKPKGAYDDNTGSWEIFCTGCGCTMMAITEADCASWWNGRALQSKDDSAALEIASRDARIVELESELAKYGVTMPPVVDGDKYDTPEHGWTCFHCGCHFENTFRGWQSAGYHFGWTPDMQPACRIAEEEGGLPKRLRAYEDGQKADQKTSTATALEIDRLKGEIARLRAALEPFAQTADRVNSLSDNAEIKCAVGYLRKARAALQTDGGKL